MTEQDLYEKYLEERQWNYIAWEDYRKIHAGEVEGRKTDGPVFRSDEE